MKIGIFSDCHLGSRKFRKTSNFQNSYEYVTNRVFEEALEIFESKDIENCILAGDLFDSPNPTIKTIIESQKLVYFANKLHDKNNGKLYILGGNHDWSQANDVAGCHPFDVLTENTNNIISCTNEAKVYNIGNYDRTEGKENIEITMIPYKSLNEESYQNIYTGSLNEKKEKGFTKSILVFHGHVDLNEEVVGNQDFENVFYLPKEVASNYDLVISGHVHLRNIIDTKSTSILTPGSIMPSERATSKDPKPAVYIYDTNTGKIESVELKKSIKIIEINTTNINEVLQTIADNQFSFNLYSIKYNGKLKDIDEKVYKLACENVLNIAIQTNESLNLEDLNLKSNINKIDNFWKIVEENHPEYYDEFKNILKGENI